MRNLNDEKITDLITMVEKLDVPIMTDGKPGDDIIKYGIKYLEHEIDAKTAAKAVLAEMR